MGVRLFVGGHQACGIHIRIALGGGEGRVAKQVLDGAKVRPGPQQMGRKGVPKGVGCSAIGQAQSPA